ncbi:putative mitochondrial carrier protein [Aspergillus homomorphus CBS 101889]|uniref:Putative mitochondrial carrier protein n=1 Tax=Aspergillus homomorphus (strain CBS 101889) TaxID=1450537 RepID=A0A395HXF4_ASPHC|nr:putative mitochondrial carrier protein [Aspergillus homomorphus CBS 101889]RAL11548.1 putative mitochondrial carrier protein [Aspergillus homomorphus CBS 101889]
MPSSNSDIWLSGAFAVVVTDFMVYPFDTLKTRIQSPNYSTVYKDATTGNVKRSLLFKGLYQGVRSVVLATIPASGAFFTTYESIKQTLTHLSTSTTTTTTTNNQKESILPTPVIHSLASCTAEAVSCFILTPAEVLKQNAQMVNDTVGENISPETQARTRKRRSVTLTVLRRFRHQPWKLWSGYTALLGRNLPFRGFSFRFLSESSQEGTANAPDSDSDSNATSISERVYVTGIAGSVAGTISSVVTTPIDVVKTRMMLAATSSSSQSEDRKQKRGPSAWAVGKEVYRREGVKGLFRGGALRAFWTAISFGIYLGMYEGGKVYLGNRRAEKDARADEGAPL